MDYFIFLPNRKAKYYWIDLGLAICGFILFMAGKWIPAVLMAFMAVTGFLVRKKPYLHFSEGGIRISMIWVKKYGWKELDRVMLKDGMLTMDFANNKLFQEAILNEVNAGIDEEAFNAFCSRHIGLSKEISSL